jgi:RNA polymerase sigma-70 factor (ECF subfamily)
MGSRAGYLFAAEEGQRMTAAEQVARKEAPGVVTIMTAPQRPRFEEVYAEHSRAVFTFLCFQTGDPAAADDLLSAVFEKVYLGLHRFDPRRGPLKPWLYAIVRNCLRSHQRRSPHVAHAPVDRLPSAQPGPEDLAVAHDTQRELATAVSRLARRDREVIGLKFTAGLSNESIARVLGLRKAHVAVVLHRAIVRLRAQFQEGAGNER